MAIDQTKVGRVVAEQMEALEADYGDESEIGDVCTIVEVRGPHGSHVRVRGSNPSPHVMIGLLRLSEAMFVNGLRGRPPGEAEDGS